MLRDPERRGAAALMRRIDAEIRKALAEPAHDYRRARGAFAKLAAAQRAARERQRANQEAVQRP